MTIPSHYKTIPARILRSCAKNTGSTSLAPADMEYLQTNTNIEREEIESQYQAFLVNHPDGHISRKCFQSILGEGYPGTNTSKISKHIWRMYDTNKDGFIDFREFMMVLYVMSHGSSEENLKQIFRVFDINNDGNIDMDEMKRLVKDLLKHDGEFKDIKKVESLSECAFSEMDENNDGKINQEEFSKACLAKRKCSTELALKIIDIFLES